MEAIIFVGIQGAGKSTFYRTQFFNTHIRINLDMLKTRNREQIIFQSCLEAKQSFVVDNTNPTVEERRRYIPPAKAKKIQVIGYYFDSLLEECKQRNNQRIAEQIVPLVGLLATSKKLVLPTWQEGFDALYTVKTGLNDLFTVEQWHREI
ncbi:MAG: AAA family ATPase [Rhizonema sp. PD38]|nr:AAA family ATPase [Rhizonema sp. PD38]